MLKAVMRWFIAVAVLVALAVTPALALACDARCLDATHAHHGQPASSHEHLHGHHHSDAASQPAVTTSVAVSHADAKNCTAHIDQAMPAAPRHWAPANLLACAAAAFHPGPAADGGRPSVSDPSPPRSVPRLALPLRV